VTAMRLEIENVDCGYAGKAVLSGVTMTVQEGEIWCVLGPNGVGKTTLFKTILKLLPRLGGEIFIDGRNLDTLTPAALARYIGYVPQSHIPPFAFTVADVILMGRAAHLGAFGRPGPADRKIVDEVMERLNITRLAGRAYTELSGGERQRVAVARAMINDPLLILADEPTGNLDPKSSLAVAETLYSAAEKRGTSLVVVTHDERVASRAKKQYELENGVLVQ